MPLINGAGLLLLVLSQCVFDFGLPGMLIGYYIGVTVAAVLQCGSIHKAIDQKFAAQTEETHSSSACWKLPFFRHTTPKPAESFSAANPV